MKTLTLIAMGIFCSLGTLYSQCITIESVHWNDDQFAVNFEITTDFDAVHLPDGSTLSLASSASETVVLPIARSGDVLDFLVEDGDTQCFFSFDPDESTRLTDAAISIESPSSCSSTDGVICLNLPVGVLDFTIGNASSSDGCFSGLEAGTVTFNPGVVSGEDGVDYYNSAKDVDLLQLEIELTASENMLTPSISGGSGDYVWYINDSPANTPIPAAYKGCAVLDVTDNITGCKAVKTEYLTPTIIGDLSGGSLDEGSDGCILTADLLVLLNAIGTTGSSSADFDCNMSVNIHDLLFFLSRFQNNPCQVN